VVAVEEGSGDGETRLRIECAEGSDPAEEIFHLAVARGWTLRELSREALSLEDVFVRLTRHEETAPGEASAPAEAPAKADA
jgi:hypothetical protein